LIETVLKYIIGAVIMSLEENDIIEILDLVKIKLEKNKK